MNKTEFIDLIAKEHSCTKIQARDALEIILSSVTSALKNGEEIVLTGFGKFYTSFVESKSGINPKTRAKITIPPYTSAKFSAGAVLKETINNAKNHSKGADKKSSKK
jgi:DNA-binding protein HU-beta